VNSLLYHNLFNGLDITGNKIRFNKSYSLGELKGTKNGKTRYFPVNQRIKDCLDEQSKKPQWLWDDADVYVVFPSHKGGYIAEKGSVRTFSIAIRACCLLP